VYDVRIRAAIIAKDICKCENIKGTGTRLFHFDKNGMIGKA
jgi:hypothetical protein